MDSSSPLLVTSGRRKCNRELQKIADLQVRFEMGFRSASQRDLSCHLWSREEHAWECPQDTV